MNLIKKAVFRGATTYKSKFSRSSSCLTVSVGQPAQAGDKLGAAIQLINRSFASCAIMACDSLQRFTLKMDSDLSLAQLHDEANKIGEKWITDHQPYFNLFTIPYRIIRWDHWLNHPDYPEKRRMVEALFLKDANYREAFYSTTMDFWARYRKRLSVVNNAGSYEKLLPLSIEYLKEECAVFLLWADAGYDFEIYTTDHNDAIQMGNSIFVYPYLDKIRHVSTYVRSKPVKIT